MKSALLLTLAFATAFAQDPFNEKPSYARSRDFDLQHLKLELEFDLPLQKLIGTATLSMAPLSDDLREVVLDSAVLNIDSITVNGLPLKFRTADDKLYIALDRTYPSGAPIDFVIQYNTQPKRGLFFVFPDKHHPNRPKQIWANGDTAGGNNRFWFPSYDFPNDKTTTEMLVTVPSGWQAISNGKLVSSTDNKLSAKFHWSQDKPMSTYLVSLVAGEFDKSEVKWTVPVEFYVPRGRGADASRTFARTTAMLDFFSANIAPYPWAKYSQAMVDTFGGGMENTSATTEAASAILEAHDFEDRRWNTDGLIAHEMAHQWFGDLVTCADWRHTWLNEGFATYFAALWDEHTRGRDIFDWQELRAARQITAIPARVAVVPQNGQDENSYGLIYNKGGWVLHMVRGQLGDARFWRAIQYYTQKFSYKTATTSDFVEAISESTGQDLEWLFDQYVYKPGHPQFEVSWDYDSGNSMLHLAVKQNQRVDGKPAPFRLPVEIEVLGDSSTQSFKFWVGKETDDLYLGVHERPRTVLFDPRDIILKSIDFKKPVSEWAWQLEHSPRVLNRSEAAFALGSLRGPEAITALTRAGLNDAFDGIRMDAATSLGRIKGETVRGVLTQMLADREAPVRATAINSLSGLNRDPVTISVLLELAKRDRSYQVRQTALILVARMKPERGFDLIRPFLDVEFMKAAATQAVSNLADESTVPTLLELSQNSDDRVRQSALGGLAMLGRNNPAVRERLLDALTDTDKGDRQTAIFAIRQRRDMSAIPALETLASTTGSQNEQVDVELFCGIMPIRARPTRETLRGIY